MSTSTISTADLTASYVPGDAVPSSSLPSSKQGSSKTLTLGPGLHYTPPSTINATTSGSLVVDNRKKALWLENNGRGRYVPSTGDLVIATVHHSSVDYYHLSITPYASFATLPQLAFEGATKKSRPMLQSGSLVYARISLAHKHMDPELECVHPSTGKSDGLGELHGGMLFDITLGMARRMMMTNTRADGGVAVLEELGNKGLRFEIAVGRNGRVWVNSESVKSTIIVGKAIQETDEKSLNIEEQIQLVKQLLKT